MAIDTEALQQEQQIPVAPRDLPVTDAPGRRHRISLEAVGLVALVLLAPAALVYLSFNAGPRPARAGDERREPGEHDVQPRPGARAAAPTRRYGHTRLSGHLPIGQRNRRTRLQCSLHRRWV
jgi:hypothetical protein